MVYLAGKAHHKLGDKEMVEHIVELVEARAVLEGLGRPLLCTRREKGQGGCLPHRFRV